mgnify:CR=1 FL=1
MAELLPNFYKVTHSEHINETDWVVQVMLNPQHAIYSGHFPQQPDAVCRKRNQTADDITNNRHQIAYDNDVFAVALVRKPAAEQKHRKLQYRHCK